MGVVISQAGIVDIESANPQVPTQFDADVGFAIPIANVLEVLGDTSAAGSTPVHTEASGNTVTTFVQTSQSIAATDATKIGLAAFDETMFNVDANGFVQLAGGSVGMDSVTGDDSVEVVADGAGNINFNGNIVANATNPKPLYFDGDAVTFTEGLELQVAAAIAVAPADTNDAGICSFDSSAFTVNANGYVQLIGGDAAVEQFTPDFDFDGSAATPVEPQSGNINLLSYNPSVANVTNVYNSTGLATGNLQVEHKAWLTALVVDPSATIGTRGTFQTITAALAAASSGQVIFLRPGTYTENLTLKSGVDLVAFTSDFDNGIVEIVGKLTYTAAGTVNIQEIKLTTNGDYFLSVTGANDSVVNVKGCYLNVADFTGMNLTTTGTDSQIVFEDCYGDIAGLGLTYFTITGAGGSFLAQKVVFKGCHFRNNGSSVTASTSTTTIRIENSFFFFPLSFTSAGLFARYSEFSCNNISTTAITSATSGTLDIAHCMLSSATAAAMSIGAGTTVTIYISEISSSNTNAITGAGSIDYAGLTFSNTSSNINVTTQTLSEEGPSRTIGSANVGGSNILTTTNTDNTNASSDSAIVASVGGTSGGEAYFSTSKGSTVAWAHGLKAGAGTSYILSTAAAASTTPDSGTEIIATNINGSTSFRGQADGSTTNMLMENVNNTASSSVNLALRSAGSTAGDAWIRFQISGAGEYSLGVDNSDSDALCLTNTSTLNGTNYIHVTTAGEINYAFQPAFLASNTSDVANVSGDGTLYTCVYGTEIFDQNSDFSSNTFTAPVTGRYHLSASIGQGNIGVAHIISQNSIVTSNRNYCFGRYSPYAFKNTFDSTLFIGGSYLCDMDAGDTAIVRMAVSGGTKIITYLGNTGIDLASPPYFSGYLEC